MLVLELVKYLRESVLDDTGGTNIAWQDISEEDAAAAQLRWTNEELTFFLTQAEREATRRAALLNDNTGTYDITTVIGQSEYPLDSKVLEVLHAELNGRQLSQWQTEDFMSIRSWRDKSNTPTAISMDAGTRVITLYPKPIAVDNIEVVVRRMPLADLSWKKAAKTSPEIPEFHHFALINYAAYLAYMKDEANTLDPTRAGSFKSLFDNDYPAVSMSAEVRKLRNRGRTVSYGGI